MTDIQALFDAADELTDSRQHDAHTCVLCVQLRPKSKPRVYYQAQACGGCRGILRDTLAEIPESYALLPDSLERGGGVGERIRGGEVEAAMPFREDVWDLLQPVRYPPIRAFLADQIGFLSVATVLHGWTRDWCDIRGKGENGPVSDVVAMVGWMVERTEWACDEHPAVDEFAAEIRTLSDELKRLVGDAIRRPQRCKGVPCRRCDLMTLARLADGSGDVECQNGNCKTIYRADEYDRWTRLVAAAVKDSKLKLAWRAS